MGRKYISEFALNMHMTHDMLLQQDDLLKVGQLGYFGKNAPCHIYAICKRPRITLEPKDFKVYKGEIVLPFQIHRQDKLERAYMRLPYNGPSDINLVCEYPYNFFAIKTNNGKLIQAGKTALLFQTIWQKNQQALDLNILYIGQSYGVAGARTAPERLKNHSTLQGIYSESILRNPDSEIWILLTSFEQVLLSTIDGTMETTEEQNIIDTKHVNQITKAVFYDGLKEQQVINFTEAALIRYFQPPYNIEYKETFPNPAHSTYSECYELDIHSVGIELNTANINCRLYSGSIPPSWIHYKQFSLHSSTERKDMFDFEKPIHLHPPSA